MIFKKLKSYSEIGELLNSFNVSSEAVGKTFNSLTEAQQKLVLSGDLLTEQQKRIIVGNTNLSMSEAGVITTTEGVIVSEQKATATTYSLSSAFKGLAASLGISTAALGAIVGVLGTVAIGAVAYKKWAEYQEELRQSAKEAASALNEQNKSVDSYVERYKELRVALQNAKGDEEATYAVKQDLLTLQNELNDAFGEEYGRLNLVTDAYRDQTEAIKAYNKEIAQNYLNENDEAIRTATRKMEEDNHYNLSYGSDGLYSDEGLALQEIAKLYEDKGISIFEDESAGTFSIHLDASAEDAQATITDFMNDVREKAKELGDEELFSDVLEISSSSLNQSQSIIDSYGEIYKKALLSEIAIDTGLSNDYNQIVQAVENYNEAILSSEDPYNDDKVKNAWDNLQTLKQGIQDNTEEWGKYEAVTTEAFEQANDSIYSFYQAMQNNGNLSKLTNDLRGLSDIELQSMTDDDIKDPFDKLCESAKEYGLEVQDVIDLLIKLGIVQGKIVDESNDAGISEKWSFSETIKNLDTAKEKLLTLDETYAKLFDAKEDGTDIGIDDYSSLLETFSDIEGIDIESHLKVFESAGQDAAKVKVAVESLIGEYLEYSGILDNVTEENKNLVQTMLEEIGVINAEEIVLAALNGQFSGLSVEKEFLSEVTTALTENTFVEIDALLQEMDISKDAQMALSQLALEKIHVNNVTIDTSADIANIFALAEAAGASTSALAKLEKAKAIISGVEAMKSGNASGVKIDMKEYKEALALIESVENGTFDYGYEKIDLSKYLPEIARPKTQVKYDPSKKEGTATNKAVKDAAEEAKEAAESVKEAFEETFDFFDRRVKVLSDALSLLETNMENVTGAFAKNNLIDAQIGINTEKVNNYTDAMAMYTQKANEALSKLPSDIQSKIKDGAVDLTTFIGDGNEEVVEAINEYSQWADKVSDCKQELAALKEAIRDLELEKFNNIMQDFTDQFDLHEGSKDLIDKQIALFKEAGQLIGESFYSAQIDQTKKQIAILEEEKKKLSEQMTSAVTSGRVEIGSDEWLEMVGSLKDVEGSILDAKTALEEFDNELLNLHTEIFNRIQEQFSNIDSELENLRGLFDTEKVSDGYGNWNKEALVQLGMLTQQYELAKYQVEQYDKEIDLLNQQYLEGRYSATEYADRLAELSSAQWDAVNSSEDMKDAIMDLNETRINESIETIEKEIEKYKELIDAQIEALRAAKDLHDYKESIAEKNKSINDLERQIAAMQNDTTASTVAKRKLLEEQLAEAKKDLDKAEYDHSIEVQEEALNKEFERYEEERNAEIEALRKSLEDKEAMIFASFEAVKQNATLIGQELVNMATTQGISISNAIVTSWQNGETAIASYGTVLNAATSSFIGQLMGVENEVYMLQNQANVTADSLAWMFATRADNLVGQLTASYYSEQNLNAMTQALRDSLINTLERGYNISSITSAFDQIANSASKAASAARDAASAIHSMNSQSVETPKTSTTTTNRVTGGSPKKVMMYYAKGTRNAKGGIAVTDEEGYEYKLSKLSNGKYTPLSEGSQVFTKEQTDKLYELSKSNISSITPMKSGVTGKDIIKPGNSSTVQVGTLIKVEGNIDSSNIKQMENIANKAVDRLVNKMSAGIKYRNF